MNIQEIDFINKAHEKFSQFILDHQILDEQIRAKELGQQYNKPLQVESYEMEIQKLNEQNEKELQELEKKKKNQLTRNSNQYQSMKLFAIKNFLKIQPALLKFLMMTLYDFMQFFIVINSSQSRNKFKVINPLIFFPFIAQQTINQNIYMLNSKKLIKTNQLTELNNFLLQVKQAFLTDDFQQAIETANVNDNKIPLQEILQNNIPQAKQDQQKQPTQLPTDEIQNLLQGLTTLLEKNLQESHDLYQIFQSNKQFNSKAENSNTSFKYQNEENVEELQEDIKQNEIRLLQMQNSRLLSKIESLNEQITQLEQDINENSKDQRQLINLINSTYCIQRVQYTVKQNTNVILSKVNDQEIEQGVFVIVDDQIILSPSYLDENNMILNISQILDVTYQNDLQITIHYKEGKLVLILENHQEFAKIDLSLWSILRKNVSLNQEKLFENSLFERPFRQEINIDNKKLREQLSHIIPQMGQEQKQQQQLQQQQQQQFTLNFKNSDHFPEIPQISNIQLQSHQSPELRGTQPKQIIQINQQTKLQHALLQLKQGFSMIKYSEGQRKPNIKIIYLTENEQYIKWKEELQPFDQKNISEKKSIQISQIKEIKDSALGSGFEKFKKYRKGKETLGITIIAKRNLELDAPKQEIKDLFLECLKILLENKQNNKLEQKIRK